MSPQGAAPIVALVAAATLAACGGEPRPPAPSDLRAAFPEQAARISEGAFARVDGGYALAGGVRGLSVALPESAPLGVAVSLSSGFALRVIEDGAFGAAEPMGGAVSYRRADGRAIWTSTDRGVEEWLFLARADGEVASWHLEGARARQAGEMVEVLDAEGRPRVRVTAPQAFAENGEPIATRLVAREDRIAIWVEPTEGPVLVDPLWSATGDMATPRRWHSMTTLMDGRVLAAGGYNAGAAIAACEIWDPATDAWSPAASMPQARFLHTATLLPDGRVLVVGGDITAIAYDPLANAWDPAGTMSTTRSGASATLLENGSVLVAGGSCCGGLLFQSVERWLPGSETFVADAPLITPRGSHTATRLLDGTVLVAGGSTTTGTIASTELYTPGATIDDPGTWIPRLAMSLERSAHAAQLLNDGDVLVGGGGTPTTERYDPDLDAWTYVGDLSNPYSYVRASALLGDGSVIFIGGYSGYNTPHDDVERYLPDLGPKGTWFSTAPLIEARGVDAAAVLLDGRVLVAGGYDDTILASAEVLEPILDDGDPCSDDVQCTSGHCADGVCCDQACPGACAACSVAEGAATDGVCVILDASPCEDGDACTEGDTCAVGVCLAGGPLSCTASDECHDVGTCDAASGCNDPAKTDGTPCSNGACQDGICIGDGGGVGGSGGDEPAGGGGPGGAGGASGPDGLEPPVDTAEGCACRSGAGSSSAPSLIVWMAVGLFFFRRGRRA